MVMSNSSNRSGDVLVFDGFLVLKDDKVDTLRWVGLLSAGFSASNKPFKKQLLVTSATLVVTGALLVVTRSY